MSLFHVTSFRSLRVAINSFMLAGKNEIKCESLASPENEKQERVSRQMREPKKIDLESGKLGNATAGMVSKERTKNFESQGLKI